MSHTKKAVAFVAMPHSERYADVYEFAIKPAAEESNIQIKRVCQTQDQDSILGLISNSIKSSDLLIAVTTNRNPHVYLEIGIAISLGKPCLIVASNSDDLKLFGDQCTCLVHNHDLEALASKLKVELELAISNLGSS